MAIGRARHQECAICAESGGGPWPKSRRIPHGEDRAFASSSASLHGRSLASTRPRRGHPTPTGHRPLALAGVADRAAEGWLLPTNPHAPGNGPHSDEISGSGDDEDVATKRRAQRSKPPFFRE
jgi:hypothetical protein